MKPNTTVTPRALLQAFTAALVLAAMTVGPACWSTVTAAEQKGGDKRETRKVAAMSEAVYKKLTEAQELIEARKTNEGLAVLEQIRNMKSLSPYELAQLWNYYAYTYFTLERYKDAIGAYEKVLQQPELPEALENGTLYTLAQLYFQIEQYQKAVDTIKRWFAVVTEPTENAYLLLGQGYYQLKKYKEALDPIQTAMKLVKARGEVPKENLYLLLRVLYYELNDYKNMADVIRELIAHYPKTDYWLTLAGTYSELKQLRKQMSIMEMLYEHGDLVKENQVLNLANLYLLHDVPYKAAKVMQKGVDSGLIKAEVKNLRLLSQAWLQAQETEKSLPPLEKAAKMSDDGELYVRLGQAYINLDRWSSAVEALQAGLKKGGVKRPDSANIMLGLALFELDKFDAAKAAFRVAQGDRRSAKTAGQWISYIESEQDRQQALQESLKSGSQKKIVPPPAGAS
ncbi:MAG: CDC27 family protein [Gammaproteobacteria bacterium]|nr:CDC27 family protein [Gammaproteobacteria bacterium]